MGPIMTSLTPLCLSPRLFQCSHPVWQRATAWQEVVSKIIKFTYLKEKRLMRALQVRLFEQIFFCQRPDSNTVCYRRIYSDRRCPFCPCFVVRFCPTTRHRHSNKPLRRDVRQKSCDAPRGRRNRACLGRAQRPRGRSGGLRCSFFDGGRTELVVHEDTLLRTTEILPKK